MSRKRKLADTPIDEMDRDELEEFGDQIAEIIHGLEDLQYTAEKIGLDLDSDYSADIERLQDLLDRCDAELERYEEEDRRAENWRVEH